LRSIESQSLSSGFPAGGQKRGVNRTVNMGGRIEIMFVYYDKTRDKECLVPNADAELRGK
jgi:hypothetical protein